MDDDKPDVVVDELFDLIGAEPSAIAAAGEAVERMQDAIAAAGAAVERLRGSQDAKVQLAALDPTLVRTALVRRRAAMGEGA